MDFISDIIEKQQAASMEELIACFDHVKKNGVIVIIKFDGEKKSKSVHGFHYVPGR